jgi:Heparinase II/III-like protein
VKRRDFISTLIATTIAARLPLDAQESVRRPRMLIADADPFTGLHILKARYAAGLRPPQDMEGLALSWRITGQSDFADRALAEVRAHNLAKNGRPSKAWVDYARWALVFDWLFDYPGFDRRLKDRVAGELRDGAAAMFATADFKDPRQYSYHNYALRYLALAAFASTAIEGYPGCETHCAAWRDKVHDCLQNVLQTSEIVDPDGSYHESMDYMRITWASFVLLAELQRTATGIDPAHRFSVFQNVGTTYLYKLLPDGTPSREGDNEYPVLDSRDTALLGYAVNRFKDPYAAWLLRRSGFFAKEWPIPVLQFLWDDPEVIPRNPAQSTEGELSRQRFFSGVGHLVMRNGWSPSSTWIEFDCGPYLAKHQHLDQNQFTIYHRGYLAIDSGADYTDTESPHYLNYYRRTVAHNSILVYDPAEKFFWSDNVLPAANDGGQRMDSARYWNSIRSREDFERTRDLWDLGRMRVIDFVPGRYQYALGDATNAYSRTKVRKFTRELLYTPEPNLLFVFDRVVSTNPNFKKAWLLHGVEPPQVDGQSNTGPASQDFPQAKTFRFSQGSGELLVHSLLPEERIITRRGGPGDEFYTPGNDSGGAWGSGENWPLEPAEGAELPQDPKLHRMWKLFWGEDFNRILSSNRKNVVPGAWRVEVSPAHPVEEDVFLHVLEIGDAGSTGHRKVGLLDGVSLKGAVVEGGPMVLFSTTDEPLVSAEVSLLDLPCNTLIVCGLSPHAVYEMTLGGLNVTAVPNATMPGVLVDTVRIRANEKGVAELQRGDLRNLRLRLARI